MMKKLILGAAAAVATLAAGGAAMAQPYGYHREYPAYGYGYDRSSDYRYDRYRDRDHDGVPDRWDRSDNRYSGYGYGYGHWRHHHHHHEWRERYDRDGRW